MVDVPSAHLHIVKRANVVASQIGHNAHDQKRHYEAKVRQQDAALWTIGNALLEYLSHTRAVQDELRRKGTCQYRDSYDPVFVQMHVSERIRHSPQTRTSEWFSVQPAVPLKRDLS